VLGGPLADGLVRPALEAALAVAREGEDDTPAIPAPTPLRPFLRFAKLPPRALSATRRALDGDEGFRARVAEATDEEDLGRAAWLFLARPEGWEDELAALVTGAGEAARQDADRKAEHDARRRLAGVQEALRRSEDVATAARAEAEGAGAALGEERRARAAAEAAAEAVARRVDGLVAERDRARAAAAAAKAELDTLRRRVADQEAQRRAAPAAMVEAVPAAVEAAAAGPEVTPPFDVAAVSSGLEDAAAAASALALRLRAVVAALAPSETAQAAEAAEAAAPAEPAEPAPPPPPEPRPRRQDAPPARRRPTPLPPATFVDSVEAAEHLVRVPGMVLVVDGYNISQAGWPGHPIAEQRRRLADALAELAARTGVDVRVVFDGSELRMPGVVPSTGKAVRVSFSAPGVEADDEVLELVEHLPLSRPVVVASSDRRVQTGAVRSGANVVSNEQLLAVLRR